jgi:hypothetical protein
MSAGDLKDEVNYDLRQMQVVVDELTALRCDVGERSPTLREMMAAGAFLSSFYNGVENILKRISKYHGVALPTGDQWHVMLLDRFREPPEDGLPVLFTEPLAQSLDAYRRFRHVVRTSYGIELDWAKVSVGIDEVGPVFARFRAAVTDYLDRLR